MPFDKKVLKVSTSDGHLFTTLEDFTYTRPSGEIITVPAGAETDGASTPQGIWNLLPPFGSYWLAAVLHDYLYRVTKRPRKECDDILYEAMVDLGVPFIVRTAIYDGVRLGGSWAFDDDRKAKLLKFIKECSRPNAAVAAARKRL
jgi:hypothetical protein